MEIVTKITPIILALIMLGLGLGLKLEDFTKIVKDNPGIGGNVYFEVAKAAVNNLATVSGDVSNLTQAFFYALSR